MPTLSSRRARRVNQNYWLCGFTNGSKTVSLVTRNKRVGSTPSTFMEFEVPGAKELGHIGSTVSGNGRTNGGQHIPDLRHGGDRPRTTISFRK